jgi:hypothetical protein
MKLDVMFSSISGAQERAPRAAEPLLTNLIKLGISRIEQAIEKSVEEVLITPPQCS